MAGGARRAARAARLSGGSVLGEDLREDRRRVEVDALADELRALEEEEGSAAHLEGLAGRLDAADRALMRAAQPEFGDDGVVARLSAKYWATASEPSWTSPVAMIS